MYVTLMFYAVLLLNFAASSVVAEESVPQRSGGGRPAIVSAHAWGSKPESIPESQTHTPRSVVIHHAGVIWDGRITPEVFLRNMQLWGQREKGWPDLTYHFLIAPDGQIYEGRPLRYAPQSNTHYPLAGNISIELMGNFDVQRPDARQVAACVTLTAWLCEQYGIDSTLIRGHSDLAPGQTSCPGRDFYRYLRDGQFRRWVDEAREGKVPAIEMGPVLPVGD